MVEFDILVIDLDSFRFKYIYYQLEWINFIAFCILYLLLRAICRNDLSVFDPKSYCHRLKLDCIFYFFTYNIFFILKVIPRIYQFIITSLFFDKAVVWVLIFLNFCRSKSYDIESSKWFNNVIVSTLVLVKYKYIAIKKEM